MPFKAATVVYDQAGGVGLKARNMNPSLSSTFKQAALATSLFGGLAFPPRTQAASPTHGVIVSPEEHQRLSPYLAQLPPRQITPALVRSLIEQGCMSTNTEGVVLSRHHLLFVSWDERGILLDKSIARSPRASHTAVIALGSDVEGHRDPAGGLSYILKQRVTVISFLPSSERAIRERVRIDIRTLTDSHGTPGVNWQGLDFLFHPNAYLGGTPITTSVSNGISVPPQAYWAVVRRAAELDRQRKPYHVLSSCGLREGTENCIPGVAGVFRHLPGAAEAPFTGPLRGQEATDVVARALLEAAGVPPTEHGCYESGHHAWMVEEFFRSTPSAQSGIRRYILRK